MNATRPVRRFAAAILVCLTAAGALVQAPAAAAEPSLGLRAASHKVKIVKGKREPAWLEAGIYVTASGAPFELHLSRPDYESPIELTQVLPDGTRRSLPADIINGWRGLKDFLEVEVTNRRGNVVMSESVSFCPNSYEPQRVSDDGPQHSGYPPFCSANPFTKGMVWGIDQGWATGAFTYDPPFFDGGYGTYTMTVSIAEDYVEMFGVAPEQATTSVELEIAPRPCRRHCGNGGPHPHHRAAAQKSMGVPDMSEPTPDVLPDMIALPSWGIGVTHKRRTDRDFLSFGANVWVAGAAPLVVEGFRRSDESVMDAFQYFYRDGEPVGRTRVGEMEYDTRRGHHHWHFRQFAAYRLLDETQQHIVDSTKEAFCLAPTDAIDLSLPGAEWNPGETGLRTTCGYTNSLWVRETLPLGWGDTYYQGLPGQSFDITDLPNGTYYIQVEANPAIQAAGGGSARQLYEQDTTNNTEVRRVILKGRPGNRRVRVPAWNGIDTERGYF